MFNSVIPICPVCQKPNVTAGHLLAHSTRGVTSPKKKASSARNLRKGWREWQRKRKLSKSKAKPSMPIESANDNADSSK